MFENYIGISHHLNYILLDTYERAVEKMKILENEEHAFRLESDEELEERQNKLLQEIKKQKLLREEAALDDLLQKTDGIMRHLYLFLL